MKSMVLRKTVMACHRWLGISLAGFIIWLSLTGIALNHTAGLNQLLQEFRQSNFLQRIYMGLSIGEIYQCEGQRYLAINDGIALAQDVFLEQTLSPLYIEPLSTSGQCLVITPLFMGVSDEQGWIDYTFQPPDERIKKVKVSQIGEDQWLLSTENQTLLLDYQEDSGLSLTLNSQAVDLKDFRTASVPLALDPSSLDPQKETLQIEALYQSFSQQPTDIAKIIASLHAAAFAGAYGKYLSDIIALLIILLCLLGCVAWLKRS